MNKPSILVDCRCQNAENPLWHPLEQRLYWTDIPAGHLHRYDPVTRTHEQIYEGESVGGFTIQEDGSLLLFMARGAIARWSNGELTFLIQEIPEERESRFNDVIADPQGRVFCGTMPSPTHPGSLYRLDPNGSLTTVVAGLGQGNGMGFSGDRQKFYCTDSLSNTIYRFDYDETSGAIANPQIYLKVPTEEGILDGMTIDAEGYVWSARWDGRHLYRYDPNGLEVLRIPLPVPKVSSVTFGGTNYTDIFISTAGGDQRETAGAGAGAIFHLQSESRGVPEFPSKIRLP